MFGLREAREGLFAVRTVGYVVIVLPDYYTLFQRSALRCQRLGEFYEARLFGIIGRRRGKELRQLHNVSVCAGETDQGCSTFVNRFSNRVTSKHALSTFRFLIVRNASL
jgi:hypothetical protein